MKKETFPYINNNLTFDEELHEYYLNGKDVIGVTTWLSSFDKEFNSYEIAKKVSKIPTSEYYGLDPKDIVILWESTGTRGKTKHDSIEKWLTGETESCLESKFFENLGINPENTWSEIKLCSEKLLIAGTADIITKIDENVYKIFDIKTSAKLGKEKLEKFNKQILTYGLLLKHMTTDNIKIIPGGIISIAPVNLISEGVNDNDVFKKPVYIEPNLSVLPKFKEMVNHRKKQIQ